MVARRSPWAWAAPVGAALLLALVLVLLRGEPRAQSDQGVFLSVAARMVDGDRLYAEVVDNKDPLFFYTYAAALRVGGWKAPFALDGLWLALAAISIALLLRRLRAPTSAWVAGALAYPLALTAGWYQPGLSMLAALAIAPLVGWLWLRGNLAAAGVALAVSMLFKLNLAPLAAAPALLFVGFGWPAGRRAGQLGRFVLGWALAAGLAALVLQLRGELAGYLQTIEYNVGYSSRAVDAQGPVESVRKHLDVVAEYFRQSGRWQAPAAALLVVVLFGVLLGWRLLVRRSVHVLFALSAVTLAAGLLVLSMTAVWAHHLQLLAYPGAALVASAVALAASSGRAVALGVAVASVAFVAWSSLGSELEAGPSISWSAKPLPEPAESLEVVRRQYYPGRRELPYMVFGGVSENAHAAFIGDEFELECRWFHLYPFSTEAQFRETIECVEDERPPVVLVTLGFFDPVDPGSSWGRFVSDARRVLGTRYQRVRQVYPGFQVWKLRE